MAGVGLESLPLIATSSDDEVNLWKAGSDQAAVTSFEPHSAPITCLRWTSNDRVLASSSQDGSVALSEVSGSLFHRLEAPSSGAEAVGFLALTWSPGSRYLAAAGNDAVVRIFDLQKKTQALVLRGHRAAVRAVAWSPSEVYVASSSDVGEVVVHRVQGSVSAVARFEQPASSLSGGSPPMLAALQWAPFHPSLLATAAGDGSVAVWEIRPGAPSAPPRHVFHQHSEECTGLQWSPVNQHLLASCSVEGTVCFYDATKEQLVRTIRYHSPLTCLGFASNGVYCALGTSGGELLLFDLRNE